MSLLTIREKRFMDENRYGMKTLQVVKDLREQGVNRFFVIMRHSERHYGSDVTMEPFMGLTEEGKEFSYNLGASLPAGLHVSLFSSYIGRCIETAYMVDKGYGSSGGRTETNRISRDISPFYIIDFKKTMKQMKKYDSSTFIRRWIDGAVAPSAMMNARDAAGRMISFGVARLGEIGGNAMVISVTHDWNLFLVKEFGLGLAHEEHGPVEFLEGVVIYRHNGETLITNHQAAPRPLSEIPWN